MFSDANVYVSLSSLKSTCEETQMATGNARKFVLVDQNEQIFFVRQYVDVTNQRDAVFEFMGQRIASLAGLLVAETFLVKESLNFVARKGFLQAKESALMLRSFGVSITEPIDIIDFYAQRNWRDHALSTMVLDALLNNQGRHTGELGIIVDAAGGELRPTPLYRTVAFDGTRLADAAMKSRPQWLERGTASGHSHRVLATLLREKAPDFPFAPLVRRISQATNEVLDWVHSVHLINSLEYDFMAAVVADSVEEFNKGLTIGAAARFATEHLEAIK